MANSSVATIGVLIAQASEGDQRALAELFEVYRKRLRAMVDLRLDRRLRGRIDPSDVLQEAFVDLAQKLPTYSGKEMPFYLWLRLVTGERLLNLHRRHLGAEIRDARREVSLHRGPMPNTESASLAASLLGRYSSAAGKAIKAEMQAKLQEVLNGMDEIDREIIVLRHFEEMTNGDVATVLDLTKTAASNRYIRALKRLKDALSELPGFLE